MPRLLLVEALPRSGGVSEVEALNKALDVMRRGGDQRKARHVKIKAVFPTSKSGFLREIQQECDYLHVSAHGRSDRDGGCIFVRGGGIVTPSDLDGVSIKATTVFVNACGALSDDLVKAFIGHTETKPTHYIAPDGDTWFDDALLFSLLFYKRVLFDGKSPGWAVQYPYRLRDLRSSYRWDAW